ncbi:MAG: multidrug ABC transporter ATP-binding protein [Thermofilum sp. ex4484_15]|nr:MAG: multidrug ABC transporter ATP-binding protein [Thermofilum sp. ex4484_15]
MEAVKVVNLTKRFGYFEALKGISFTVNEGEIFGLIGPNGAGKTTTFRIIAGLMKPTSGEVKVFGKDVVRETKEVRKLISYLPEEAGAYRNITGFEYLKMVAEIYFGKGSEAEEALELGIKLAGLGDSLYEKMKTYSKGMKRRIQVARALMVKPRVTILDEPTVGLDVIYSREVRGVVKDFSREYGLTVLISSHNMLEVEDICEKVAIINEGKVLTEGYVKDLLSEYDAKNLEEVFIRLVKGGK